MKNKLFIILTLLVVIFWFIKLNHPKRKFVLPLNFKQVLDEVADVDVWIGSLTPDPLGQTLAFSSGTKEGRRLVLVDLRTLKKQIIATTNEVSYVFGWSPDGRYLAFDQVPPQPEKLYKTTQVFFESWLTLYDRQSGKLHRLTDDTNTMETPFFWLPNGSYLICQRNLTNDYGEIFLGNLSTSEKKAVSVFQPDMAIVSETKCVYALKSELYLMDIKPLAKTESRWDLTNATIQKISDFKTNGFNGVVWVHYNASNSNFLFCARPKESEWRYLYQFDSAQQILTQLSHEDTYNGQWLLGGAGYAYVVNTNNSFQLAIRSANPELKTNLFDKGHVVLYKASLSGDKIYASAAIGVEPHGIWEYTVTNHILRKISEGTDSLIATRIIKPLEFQLKSFDGIEIPCFLFQPAETMLETNSIEQKPNHPLVIYVPPVSSQFQREFEAQSQLFANSGFYYAAVNYRGCDGYGAGYSKLFESKKAAQDVLELYQKLIAENPNIDRNNVFLVTSSSGIDVVAELLATQPRLWRAIGMDKCFPSNEDRLDAEKLPPMISIMGTQDKAFDSMQIFASWAATNHVVFKTVIHMNAGHITYNSNDRKDTLFQIVNFFLAHQN